MKIGFIGLGNIGILIARDLAASEHALIVYDVVPAGPAELGRKGAKVAASPAGASLTRTFLTRIGVPLPAHIVPPTPESLIGLGEKDLDCALEVGRHFGLDLPAVRMSRAAFRQTVLDQSTNKK